MCLTGKLSRVGGSSVGSWGDLETMNGTGVVTEVGGKGQGTFANGGDGAVTAQEEMR